METQLTKRLREMKEFRGNLPKLEILYYNLGADYGLLNDSLINYIKDIQIVKTTIKENTKTISEATREFELTEQYAMLKSFKYQIKALEKMMPSIRIMIEALKNEAKGQY